MRPLGTVVGLALLAASCLTSGAPGAAAAGPDGADLLDDLVGAYADAFAVVELLYGTEQIMKQAVDEFDEYSRALPAVAWARMQAARAVFDAASRTWRVMGERMAHAKDLARPDQGAHAVAQKLRTELGYVEKMCDQLQQRMERWQQIIDRLGRTEPAEDQWWILHGVEAVQLDSFRRSGSPQVFEQADALVEQTQP